MTIFSDPTLPRTSIEEELAKVVNSQTFARNGRLQDFLQFVTRASLAGDTLRVKESVVGVEVYGRESTYSPKEDPIVRTEARRLRKKLAEYYMTEGKDSQLTISMPTGSYVAHFEFKADETETKQAPPPRGTKATVWRPVLQIAPLNLLANSESLVTPINRRHTRSRGFYFGLTAGLLALLSIFSFWHFHSQTPRLGDADSSKQPDILAILPINNGTGSAGQDYLAEGITEGVITNLVHAGNLKVVSANGEKRRRVHAGGQQPGSVLAGATKVLEGSLQYNDHLFLLSLRLMDAQTHQYVWSQTYSSNRRSLPSLAGKAARDVAQYLGADFAGRNTPYYAPQTNSADAYDKYMQGLFYSSKRTAPGSLRAIEFFEQAVRLDPNYALGYAGLASTYVYMTTFGLMPPLEAFPKAAAAAKKSVELGNHQARPHTVLAQCRQFGDWDFAAAEREFKVAISLDPNDPVTYEMYSSLLSDLSRHDEAIAAARYAVALEPLTGFANARLGTALYFSRRYDESIQESRRALELQPNYGLAALRLAMAHSMQGKQAAALADVQQWFTPENSTPFSDGLKARLLGLSGKRAQAQEIINQMKTQLKPRWVGPTDLTMALIGQNKLDEAIQTLEEAFQQHDDGLVVLKADPIFDPLRSDPRFEKMVALMNFSQVSAK